jgi:SAM-dependent methyltransferase
LPAVTYLGVFTLWLEEREMAGRPDARRVARELAAVAGRIVEHAAIEPGNRVLDIGSGTGAVALAAADLGASVVGIDLDHLALGRGGALARSLPAPVRQLVGDARSLPLRDGGFDVSVHRSVLVYMDDRERAMLEERRILRPGGRVSCSESLGGEMHLQTEDRGIARVWEAGLREILLKTPDALTLTPTGLQDLYGNAGFEDVSLSEVPHRVTLDSPDAVARAFAVAPPYGLSARERWLRAGIAGDLLDEFLARLAMEAEGGRPATLVVAEGYLTARAPG